MIKLVRQLILYRKAKAAGYISETNQGGRTIWFIKKEAPGNIHELGNHLARMEANLLYITWAVKLFLITFLVVMVLKFFTEL